MKLLGGMLIGISVFGFGSSLTVRFRIYKKKLKMFDEEEKLLLQLMRVIQKECFENNKMSMEEYGEAMSQYEKKLGKTVEQKISIETKLNNLFKIKSKKKALAQERIRLVELIKDIQDKYLNKGCIETRVYENMLTTYSKRLSEVEEKMTFLEAQEALKSNKIFWKLAEKMRLGG